jgi:predicted phage terminase large subunit-like protein
MAESPEGKIKHSQPSGKLMITPSQLDSLSSLLEQRRRLREVAQLESSLSSFLRAAWHVIEPEAELSWSDHYEYLSEWLELISSGQFKHLFPDKLGLIINVPPRTAKSSLITICWPVWTWLRFPSRRFLCVSYAEKLASDHSIKRRNLITSEWFQLRFSSRFSLKYDRNRIDHYDNDKTGYHIATSVGGTGTGFGGDICIADDLLNAEDAFSEASRDSTNRWIDSTFSTRLNNPATGVFVHVSQRLAYDDPTGHLLEQQPGRWIHIKLPLEAESEEEHTFPLTNRALYRKRGDVLQPERFTPTVIESLKRKPREWAGQYQQGPVPASGHIFHPDWWRYYKRSDRLPTFDEVAISVDCAFKSAAENDYVSIQKWGAVGSRSYLLECRTEHLGYTATKIAIKTMNVSGYRANYILIEDKANGSAVIEELSREDLVGACVVAVNPEGGKESRAFAASADVEAGNVYLPEDAPWLSEFLRVHTNFPAVKHDDWVDAATQFLNWRRTRGHRYGLLEWLRLKEMEQAGLLKVHRCLMTDENGVQCILEWDYFQKLWLDPKTGKTYPPGRR